MSEEGSTVVRMLDIARVSVSGQDQLGEWLKDWARSIAEGNEGEMQNIAIIFERKDGSFGKVSQSLGVMDTNTCVGFLNRAAFAVAYGEARLYSLE